MAPPSSAPPSADASASSLWPLFTNPIPNREGETPHAPLQPDWQRWPHWPSPPPWRRFLEFSAQAEAQRQELEQREVRYWEACEQQVRGDREAGRIDRDRRRGHVFRLPRREGQPTKEAQQVLMAVNAAIHLRRPLLVTGRPGIGKSSLAHAIAVELGLGPVLTWAVTPRSQLQEGGLYLYDAVARLQDANFRDEQGKPKPGRPSSDYITLGPVGTAFLPFRLPRVLLIDEVDKGDLQLPYELLHLFEEGVFEIPQLVRDARDSGVAHEVQTADVGGLWPIQRGRVQCREFPIIVLTSNGERDFPAAFHRRCIRIDLPTPSVEDLQAIVEAQFGPIQKGSSDETHLSQVIHQFLEGEQAVDRATDQLLNAWQLLRSPRTARVAEHAGHDDAELKELLATILFQGLNS